MNKGNQTFVVIDDDPAFNRTLSRALQRRDKDTYSALNSKEALAIVEKHKPDCAILDLNLGTENGIDLINPLLCQQPALKIVVLTGYASLATAVKSVKIGAWNYLSKPTDVDTILKAFDNEDNEQLQAAPETPSPTSLKQVEWEHLQRILTENDGNISATARQLGMHRRTLQRKLQKKNIPTIVDTD